MDNVRPITPEEAEGNKALLFPPEIIDCWNTLITKALNAGHATVTQDEAVSAISAALRLQPSERHRIFEEGWLNIENVYRQAGWNVEYDKPGYNESYNATFKFTAPRRSQGSVSR